MTKEVSTLWYRAPEVLLDNLKYSHAVDMWSIGTIIHEMLYGEKMFRGLSEIEQILTIFKKKGTPSQATLQSYGKCPVLLKFGSTFPQFKAPKDVKPVFSDNNSSVFGGSFTQFLQNSNNKFYGLLDLID